MSIIKKKGNVEVIDLREVAKLLWRKARLIVLAGVLAAGAALAGTFFLITPKYTATVTMYVNNYNNKDSFTTITSGDLSASAKLVDTYIAIIKSNTLLSEVAQEAQVSDSPGEIEKMITAHAVNSTEVFYVSVTCQSADEAARLVNTIAAVASDYIADIVEGSSVKVIDLAEVPNKRSSPSYTKNTAVGLMLGMLIMAGLILIREILDTRIKSEEDLKDWGMPVLVVIPEQNLTSGKKDGYSKGELKGNAQGKKMTAAQNRQLILSNKTPFTVLEAYKTLRTNLMFSLPGKDCKKILITSAMPGEGKTTTAINLSKVFAMNGEKVLLVDCDLRLSTTADKLSIYDTPGLSDVLVGIKELSEVIQHLEDGLDVLTAGSIPPNPSELLGSESMQVLMARLESCYKYIILDAPPIAAVTDASVISCLVSGTVIVVRNGVADRDIVGSSIERLRLAGAKLLGFIFISPDDKKAYGYYGYGEYARRSRKSGHYASGTRASGRTSHNAASGSAGRSDRSIEKSYTGRRRR